MNQSDGARAMQVLRYLREYGASEQSEIAKEIFNAVGENRNVGQIACHRMLAKLEVHGFINGRGILTVTVKRIVELAGFLSKVTI